MVMPGGRIRVLVVDDEPLAREALRLRLERESDVEAVELAEDGAGALAALQRSKPDLVFLDVQMPDMSGFEVLDGVPAEAMPVVVFVTAHDEYALDAFDRHALDYLLKPFDGERLGRALDRARREIGQGRDRERVRELLSLLDELRSAGAEAGAGEARAAGAPSRLLVRERGRVVFLDLEDLDYVQADGNYLRLHAGGRYHLVRGTMQEIGRRLDPASFARIHRSTIVNLERVTELRPQEDGGYAVVLRDGTSLALSRTYRDALLGQVL